MLPGEICICTGSTCGFSSLQRGKAAFQTGLYYSQCCQKIKKNGKEKESPRAVVYSAIVARTEISIRRTYLSMPTLGPLRSFPVGVAEAVVHFEIRLKYIASIINSLYLMRW